MPPTKLFIINVFHENERKKCLVIVKVPISTIKLENTLDINLINYESNP